MYVGCIAQLVEQWPFKPTVVGSIPTAPTVVFGKRGEGNEENLCNGRSENFFSFLLPTPFSSNSAGFRIGPQGSGKP